MRDKMYRWRKRDDLASEKDKRMWMKHVGDKKKRIKTLVKLFSGAYETCNLAIHLQYVSLLLR